MESEVTPVRRAVAAEIRRNNQVSPAVSASAESIPYHQVPSLTEHHDQEAQLPSPDTDTDSDAAAEPSPFPQYSRVSPAQATEMVRLKRINPSITYAQIAAAVGVKSVSTVSYWLRELDNDTTQEARKFVKTKALKAAMKLDEQIDSSDPRVSQGAAKAITALAGVPEGSSTAVAVGVRVIIGEPGKPAGPDPFASIDATVVESSS